MNEGLVNLSLIKGIGSEKIVDENIDLHNDTIKDFSSLIGEKSEFDTENGVFDKISELVNGEKLNKENTYNENNYVYKSPNNLSNEKLYKLEKEIYFDENSNYYDLKNILYESFFKKYKISDKDRYYVNARICSYFYGFEDGKKNTLQVVADKFGITRERVRQITSKWLKKLLSSNDLKEYLVNLIDILIDEDNFITFDYLLEKLEDIKLFRIVLLILSEENYSQVIVNNDLKIIYLNNCKNHTEEIIESEKEKLDLIIEEDKINGFNYLQKKIVETSYTKHKKIFAKSSLSKTDIMNEIYFNMFSEIFAISDTETFESFKQYLKENVDESLDPTAHSFVSIINRKPDKYVMIDRGTYCVKKKSVDVPESLLNKIYSDVERCENIIPYMTLLDKYQDEFNQIGITNRYMVKGLLDPILTKKYDYITTKREYLLIGKEGKSVTDTIIDKMREFKGVFSYDDIINLDFLSGLDSAVYLNCLYAEQDNGLIFLENKKYIYSNKLNISTDVVNKLHDFIEYNFTALNVETITAYKLYARLMLKDENLIKSLEVVVSPISLFYICEHYFRNEYYFFRPIISKNKNKLTFESCMLDYFKKNKIFTRDDFLNFMDKRGFLKSSKNSASSNFTNFSEYVSEYYIQTDLVTFVSKDEMNLSDDDLKKIKSKIDWILSFNDTIYLDRFRGYSIFPRLKYNWNQFLLIGIIRSYFSEYYEVIIEGNDYRYAKYKIRRAINE